MGRQYAGPAGSPKREAFAAEITNCQIGVLAAYVSRHWRAFIDWAIYVPKDWARDTARLAVAHVSETVRFATKPCLAVGMIERAIAAAVPFAWVATDSIYGVGEFEMALRRVGRGYVFGSNSTHQFNAWSSELPVSGMAEGIAQGLDASAWQRFCVGDGTKGPRLSD